MGIESKFQLELFLPRLLAFFCERIWDYIAQKSTLQTHITKKPLDLREKTTHAYRGPFFFSSGGRRFPSHLQQRKTRREGEAPVQVPQVITAAQLQTLEDVA